MSAKTFWSAFFDGFTMQGGARIPGVPTRIFRRPGVGAAFLKELELKALRKTAQETGVVDQTEANPWATPRKPQQSTHVR